MIAMTLMAALSATPAADALPSAAPKYTVSDPIGRNPDDVCMLAYRSGHWSDWLKADAATHRAGRTQRASMEHYCDGFIHGMGYKGE
jgi:hypothetical protein